MAKRKNNFLDQIQKLNRVTQTTNEKTYGVQRDIATTMSDDIDNYLNQIRIDSDKDKSLINSHLAPVKIGKSKGGEELKELYDIIGNNKMIESIQSVLGSHNVKFEQTLKDYEIIKRCIPQIHKVINTLKNNIISPDAITTNALGIKMPDSIDADDKSRILDIVEKYSLNKKLSDIIIEYLIVSVKYMTVVPYSSIADMLRSDDVTLEECIATLEDETKGRTRSLLEASGDFDINSSVLLENVELANAPDNMNQALYESKAYQEIDSITRNYVSEIEFIDGGLTYFKNAILNEAINTMSNPDKEERSMQSILRKVKKKSKLSSKDAGYTPDGLISDIAADEIKNKVTFKGCHIEELDATRIIPFKMRDTVVGYFYVENPIGNYQSGVQSVSTVMDKINTTVYMKSTENKSVNRVENMVIQTITNKLIKAVNPKFLNDNMDDIDVIYEFVKNNELHVKAKRVIFFHPDDVCEFRRHDGSIMKNAMFLAKLYILTMLSNVITNVTRGSDRQIYYVKTGLTTDIEGHVNRAIHAIKQSQIRYSDVGTINEVFNVVGSNVDVFMPISADSEKPIETEVISGQNVDMNDDFIQFLIKSIILSFGVPSAVIEDFEQVDFAKTLSMSNLDMARATLDSQMEIIPELTKLIRLIVSYELPDFDEVDEIYATLNAPAVIIFEMNKDRLDSVHQMAETLAELFIPAEGETLHDKRVRLFKKKYFKRNMPTIDWDAVEEILVEIITDAKEEEIGEKLLTDQDNNDDQ